jgi:hypothetical protein
MTLEAIAAGISAGAASVSALSAIIPQLNKPRSVVIEIDNNTERTLTKVWDHHEHGGFAVTPESAIPPRHVQVFGAQSRGGSVATGTEGHVVYDVDGLAKLTVYWNNPFFGDNQSSATITGSHLGLVRVDTTTGVGDTAAHMRYEVFHRRNMTLVAFGPPDKWVVAMGNRILVILNDGRVFANDVEDTAIGSAYQLVGPPVAANPWDNVLANGRPAPPFVIGNRIHVILNDGRVFAHDITDNTIGPPFQLVGPPVAAQPQDKWVLPQSAESISDPFDMGDRILVITKDGRVFAHRIINNTFDVSQLAGPPVAANDWDKWVFIRGNRIFVILNDGRVFGHDFVGDTIGPAFQFDGPPVAANPWDKWVLMVKGNVVSSTAQGFPVRGDRILVIVHDPTGTAHGRVFGHDITGNTIGPPFALG